MLVICRKGHVAFYGCPCCDILLPCKKPSPFRKHLGVGLLLTRIILQSGTLMAGMIDDNVVVELPLTWHTVSG